MMVGRDFEEFEKGGCRKRWMYSVEFRFSWGFEMVVDLGSLSR